MVVLGKDLRRDLERAVARIAALELVVFGPTGNNGNVEAVRVHLKKIGDFAKLPPDQIAFLRSQLPRDWADLTFQHGHEAVFFLLSRDFDITDARERLGGPMDDRLDTLTAKIDQVLLSGTRSTRNDTIELCIALCQSIADRGGYATCCVDQLEQVLDALKAENARGVGHG